MVYLELEQSQLVWKIFGPILEVEVGYNMGLFQAIGKPNLKFNILPLDAGQLSIC